jgi:hypothetical protein
MIFGLVDGKERCARNGAKASTPHFSGQAHDRTEPLPMDDTFSKNKERDRNRFGLQITEFRR